MRIKKKYIGYWYFHNDKDPVAGSLIVGNDITLSLVDLNKKYYIQPDVPFLTGIVQDNNNDVYFFILNNLIYTGSTINSQGLQTYKFQVDYIIYSTNRLLLEVPNHSLFTSEISIQSQFLNSWCERLIKEQRYSVTTNMVDYHYINPSPILITELDYCNIFVAVNYSTRTPRYDGFFNKLESFFIIKYFQPIEVKDCFGLIKQIEHFITLLASIPFSNDILTFKIEEIDCVCIQNIKIRHYNFSQTPNDYKSTSSVVDVLDSQVFMHWIKFYEEESNALTLFFNTIYNEELSDELRIICYSSVLEELTKRFFSSNKILPLTKRRKRLEHIVSILKSDNHLNEANDLKTGYLDKDETFEVRLLNLLQKYHDVWDLINTEEFATKSVLTRNFLVHRQIQDKMANYIYQQGEYNKLARILRYIISATLLKEIGYCTDEVKRILTLLSSVWTYDDYIKVHPIQNTKT